MRAVTMILCSFAVLLFIGVAGYWFENRPAGPPSASQWKQLRLYSTLIGIADGMPCPPSMAARRMKIEEAKNGLSRLRARYTLSRAQTTELDRSITLDREIGAGDGHTSIQNCNKLGPRFLDSLMVRMAGGR